MPGATVVDERCIRRGGALPRARIASVAISLAVDNPTAFAAALRRENPAIVARINATACSSTANHRPGRRRTVISTVTYGAPEIFEA